MTRYVIRRIVLMIPVLLGVLTTVFIIVRIIPGDPVRLMVGFNAKQEAVEATRSQLGLDRPIGIQFAEYLQAVSRGDFGKSLRSGKPVNQELWRHFGNTLKLALASIALATLVGMTLGVMAAVHRGKALDRLVTALVVLGISMPSYYLGILLILLFSVLLRWLPAGGAGSLSHLVLPAVTLAAASAAVVARLTRGSVLEVVAKDYVRTARAKGLSYWRVLLMHVLRTALMPIVTILGLEFGFMIGGTVLVEVVFSYPGLGRLLISSIETRDFPIVQAAVIVVALSFVLINFLTDISYSILDPKVRY